MAMPSVIRGRLGALIKAYAGVDAFAALVGVWPHTVWRWGTGRTSPEQAKRELMNELARDKHLALPFPDAAKTKRRGLKG
jgi:hypothetical protein